MGARRVAIGTAVLVLVLAGAVAADRVALGAAQDVGARELRSAVPGIAGEPSVVIGGFPFLTQLAEGALDQVTVRADALTVDGVEVTDVRVDAAGVAIDKPYTVHRAVLTGNLSAGALQRLLASRAGVDLDLRVDQNRLMASGALFGVQVAAVLVPRVQDGAIRVDVATVTVGGHAVEVADLPGALAARLSAIAVPLDGLPAGVVLTGIAVRAGGVRITAIGIDVALATSTSARTP